MNGPWDELDSATLAKVIRRLIGARERDGRKVKPCLVHGDLWESNIRTNITTREIYIFDAAAYYAQNKMEIGTWRVNHQEMKAKAYRQEYVRHFEKSEPVEEWDDRLKLYGVKKKLICSARVAGGKSIQQEILEYLLELAHLYGGGN